MLQDRSRRFRLTDDAGAGRVDAVQAEHRERPAVAPRSAGARIPESVHA